MLLDRSDFRKYAKKVESIMADSDSTDINEDKKPDTVVAQLTGTKQRIPRSVIQGRPLKYKTAHIREDLLEDIQKIAYWSQETITDFINRCIEHGITQYINAGGSLKEIPPEAKKLMELRKKRGKNNV